MQAENDGNDLGHEAHNFRLAGRKLERHRVEPELGGAEHAAHDREIGVRRGTRKARTGKAEVHEPTHAGAETVRWMAKGQYITYARW